MKSSGIDRKQTRDNYDHVVNALWDGMWQAFGKGSAVNDAIVVGGGCSASGSTQV